MTEALVADRPGVLARVRGRGRGLGRLSIWLVPTGFLVQGFSLVQQASHLFSPAPGERPFVVTMIVVAVVLAVLGIVAGAVAVGTPEGRRTGAFGASLGIAMLVLYAVASWLLWAVLAALA